MKTKQDIINDYAHDYRNMVWSFDSLKRILTNMVNEIEDLDQNRACNCGRNAIIKNPVEFEEIEEVIGKILGDGFFGYDENSIKINQLIRNQNKLIEIIKSLQK